MNYLDFEEPIQTLREQLEQAKEIQDKNDLDMTTTVEELEVKIQEVTKELYSKLTPWLVSQVLLFRYGIFWGGYGLLAIHLYGLLKMPVGWPPTTYLLLAAVTGGIMDVVCFTGGMHLAASVTLGMAYPTLTAAMESREGLRKGHVLDPFQDGWVRYGIFAALGLAVYWGVLFVTAVVRQQRDS